MADDPAWTHVDAQGEARMVDVGGKPETHRKARARARVRMRSATRDAILAGHVPKGNVLTVARIAAIQAAKQTAQWIPLCHALPLESLDVAFRWPEAPGSEEALLEVEAEASATARTGVEMEALVGVCAAALTVYDMVKGVDRGVVIEEVLLLRKTGGKEDYARDAAL